MKALFKKNKKFTAINPKDINIDISVTTAETTTKNNSIKDFIFGIYDAEILKFVFGFLMVALLVVLAIFSAYGLLRPRSEEVTITSQLTNDKGEFSFKSWKMTSDLEAAVDAGDISLKNITVIEKDGEIEFDGGDSNKIAVVNYETVIEKNEYPKLYSDEYWEKLCREGKNTYVLRTIGLATEKEGAE